MFLPCALDAAEPPLTFEQDIVPILEARCFKCHGAEVQKAGLDLRRRFTIEKGGDGGAALVVGKPEESPLVEMIVSGEMPPKEEGRLDEKQIALITRWVKEGAALANPNEPPLETGDADGAVTDEDRKHWSFQPPVRPPVPAVKQMDRVRTPIDAFLLAKLEEKGLTFNPDADRRVLLRRLCFDLWGLPPTPEQIKEFVDDPRPDAYEQLIDRLLDAPQYGERWGRHWLDVAGYADSDGYLEADRERPEAWRYRDYVIRAFNNDTPYNRFLTEQIAGDELVDWRNAATLTPEIQDSLIATGFLRTAADPTYPGYKEKLECYKVMADTLQIVASGVLGVTLQCARCHSHKSDPFTQRDYYQLHTVFLPAYDPDRWLVSIERAIPLATEAEQQRITQHNQGVDSRVNALNAELAAATKKTREQSVQAQTAELLKDLKPEEQEQVRAALLTEEGQRKEEQKALVAKHAPGVKLAEADLFAQYPDYKAEVERLKAAVASENAKREPLVQVRGLMDVYVEATPGRVLRRGDFNNLGQTVSPGVPAVLAPAGFQFQPVAGVKTTGRRKAFAEWLTAADNPLTARVHVNRVWAHHFGRGIVATVDDFGRQGAKPSHPELLDWLATEFVRLGWSQKALHRLILRSSAYRQTSDLDAAKAAADPANTILGSWPPQRHQGETLRDSLLALAGKLNPQMSGPPVPVSRQADGQVLVADDPAGNRRSVYLQVRRSQPVTFLEQFDTPRMEINCTRRTEAIVATQALTLLNSRFTESCAQALSERLLREAGGEFDARLSAAWERLYCRAPTDSERAAVRSFIDAAARESLGDKAAAATPTELTAAQDAVWPLLCQTLLNSNEFLFVH